MVTDIVMRLRSEISAKVLSKFYLRVSHFSSGFICRKATMFSAKTNFYGMHDSVYTTNKTLNVIFILFSFVLAQYRIKSNSSYTSYLPISISIYWLNSQKDKEYQALRMQISYKIRRDIKANVRKTPWIYDKTGFYDKNITSLMFVFHRETLGEKYRFF